MLRDGAYPAQQKELIEQQKRSLYYAGKQAEFGLQEREKARRMLLDSDICKYFKEICNEEKDTHLPPEKWNLLEQTVNTAYKDFTVPGLKVLHTFFNSSIVSITSHLLSFFLQSQHICVLQILLFPLHKGMLSQRLL